MLRRDRYALVWVLAAVLAVAAHASAADTDLSVISKVGFSSVASGPYVLMGTTLVDHAQGGSTWQMKVTNQVGPDAPAGTLTVGLRSEWRHYSLFGYYYSLGGDVSWSQSGDATARSVSFFGQGVIGRVQGSLAASYNQAGPPSFAWKTDGRTQLIAGGPSGYQLNANVSAQVGKRLNWGQELLWAEPLSSDTSGLLLTTGPELKLADGQLSAGAGVVIRPSEMRSIGTLSYTFAPSAASTWSFAAGTSSLWRDQPFLEAGYQFASTRWRLGTVVRFDYSGHGALTPAFFISVQPS